LSKNKENKLFHIKLTIHYCGGDYSASHKCPAKAKICSNCDKPNHFADVCKSTKKPVNFIIQQQQNHDRRNNSSDELFIDIININ